MNIRNDNPKTGGMVQANRINVKKRFLNSLEVIRKKYFLEINEVGFYCCRNIGTNCKV
jgi:hypothetical protein